jgi:iron complex transport system substrate-binding protein
MKRMLLLILVLNLFGCSPTSETKSLPEQKKENSTVSYASHFDLIQTGDDFLLHFMSPESGEIEHRFFLTKTIDSSRTGYTTIEIPSTKLITLSGTSIGMLSTLDKQQLIVGVSNKNYVYDPKTRNRIENNEVIEVGEESNLPLEKIIQSSPQLILYSGFGSDFPGSKKLNALGIKSIPIYDWRETHPLGKAEWIKLFGALSNSYEKAESYFNEIESAYFELKEEAKTLSESPTILSGNLLGDIWYAPNGNSFVAQMLEDAHVTYKYREAKGTGSVQLSLEQVIKDNTNTEFWINPGFSSKNAILELNTKLKHIGPLDKNTYCYSHNINLFWERSAIEPHHVLSDFIQIFHNVKTSDSLYFYKNIE